MAGAADTAGMTRHEATECLSLALGPRPMLDLGPGGGRTRRMPIPDAVLALPARLPELRDRLVRWCRQNSGSDHPAGLAAMRALLAEDFARLPGAVVEHVSLGGTSAQVLRIRLRPEAPVQILCSGHYDTVYGPEHPFQDCTLLSPEILRGPGVADMKGGLVIMLAALGAFQSTPFAARVGFEVILAPDEEIGSQGTRPVLLEAAPRHRCALVFEPARPNGDLVKSRKGTGIITLTVHGRAAHAGRAPADGRNAILALCELLPAIDRLATELPGVLVNVGRIAGGGAANIVPDLARAVVNLRATRPGDDDLLMQRIREVVGPLAARDGYRVELSGGFNRRPKVETPAECALFAEWQRTGAALGQHFGWQHVGGGSDGNILSEAGLPNLDGLGAVGDRLHSPDEFCHLPSLAARAQLAALFLHRVAAGEIALPDAVAR